MSSLTFKDQFFGKTFRLSLVILIGLFLLAIVASVFQWSFPILLFIGLLMTILTAQNPMRGIAGVFLELLSNPHGYLISTNIFVPLSLRMTVFIGFFLGYLLYLIRVKTLPRFSFSQILVILPLTTAVILGMIRGILLQNPLDAFQDGNAYFFLLYAIPIFSLSWKSSDKLRILQIFAAGAIGNVLASLGILYVFSHFEVGFLRIAYVFLRDVRFAEITDLGMGVYRVFLQSQFFVFAFSALLIPFFFSLSSRKERFHFVLVLGSLLTVFLLSLSRSFWVGMSVATLALVALLLRTRFTKAVWRSFLAHGLLSAILAVFLILFVTVFPFPTQRLGARDLASAFKMRTQEDVAIFSRWKLLDPMRSTVNEHVLLGSGFGTTISFVSDDPRVREINPDGFWSTYAMEWGWLELWIKMGILGPLSFLFCFFWIVKRFLQEPKTEHGWIGIGLVSGLVFLFATHFFSPYLNHPIGLGYILLTIIFLPEPASKLSRVLNPATTRTLQQTQAPASLSSLRAEE